MKKLSDYKGVEAIELTADIMEPLAMIFADKEILELSKQRGPMIRFIKPALKNHKIEVIEILARIEGVPVEEYVNKISVATLPMQILTLINDPQVRELFPSQGQKMDSQSSGPAMGSTKE